MGAFNKKHYRIHTNHKSSLQAPKPSLLWFGLTKEWLLVGGCQKAPFVVKFSHFSRYPPNYLPSSARPLNVSPTSCIKCLVQYTLSSHFPSFSVIGTVTKQEFRLKKKKGKELPTPPQSSYLKFIKEQGTVEKKGLGRGAAMAALKNQGIVVTRSSKHRGLSWVQTADLRLYCTHI